MSYTTLYCNEQMLLDNWRYYDESNQKLRNTLQKTNMSPEQCANFYLDNMHNRESVNYSYEELVERFRKQRGHGLLLNTTSIPIYQGDIDYITQANDAYDLSIYEMRVLFGVIFLCRLFKHSIARLDTNYKLRGFTKLFKERTPIICVHNSEHWYDCYNTIDGLPRVSDELELLNRFPTENIGCLYEYPDYEFAAHSDIIYTYDVTLETNRLWLSDAFKIVAPYNDRKCIICGKKITAHSHSNIYCKRCAESKEGYRIILRNNVNESK